ncbi:hypothetical protein RvY_04454-2 [Ramazzottius varieornatus]|uniref:alkaline phosphatase n=1 Tax=Ramazzottius varieornatus TaxID=947166 RepID=A0A1D1V0X9_RAMVA|nr:hypothetical protein RvY_04454-2 [Ramazzottius varieornatus]
MFRCSPQVIFGGRRRMFLPKAGSSPHGNGSRQDGVDLIDRWITQKAQTKFFYVTNFTDMNQLEPANTDYVFGLFNNDHMNYELERNKTTNNANREPSLKEMTEKAIDILLRHGDGFFLAFEGGKIDHGHHAGKAKLAMYDVLAFDEAIEVAVNKLGTEETLFVVTADHSHSPSMGGYAKRGNSILGFGGAANTTGTVFPNENVPYLTLAYANGPGGGLWFTGNYTDPASILPIGPEDDGFIQDAGIPLSSETLCSLL